MRFAMIKVLKTVSLVFAYSLALAVLGWTVLAVHFCVSSSYRDAAAAVLAVVSLALLVFVRPRWAGVAGNFCLFLLVLAWWSSIRPSNDRDWNEDVRVLPYAEVMGDSAAIHNIRNIDYRSETDFDLRYYDKVVDLSQLESVDLFISHWGSKAIAHPIISFNFGDGGRIAVSIETRKRKGQEYSAVAGFFRQYELIYIVADERDVIRLRTNYRREDVYLYHLGAPRAKVRKVFLDYLRHINHLRDVPEFYNALVDNCTTNIFVSFQVAPPYPPLSLGVVLPGFLGRDFYRGLQKRGIDISYETFQQRSYISPAAQQADQDPNFSERIREGLPDYFKR